MARGAGLCPLEQSELFIGELSSFGIVALTQSAHHSPPLGPLLGLTQPTLLSALAVALGGLILLAPASLRLWRRFRHRAAPTEPPSVQSQAETLARIARDRESLQTLMKEVRDLTALCARQIDSRVERLERLLAEADRRIEAPPSDRPCGNPDAPLIGSRSSTPASPANARRPSRPEPFRAPNQCDTSDPIARQVYELADQGRSPLQIAGAIEEHVGKVELILALRA